VLNSVIDAIRSGILDFEPVDQKTSEFDETEAMPGTEEKVGILAERIRQGLPLWHPEDRNSYSDEDEVL